MRRAFAFVGGIGAALALVMLMAPSGGFPSRPRFQSVGIAASAPTGTGGLDVQRLGVGIGGAPAGAGAIDAAGTITARGDVSVLATSTTNPTVELEMADATADNRRWRMRVSVETFLLQTLNDAGSQIRNFLAVDRTLQAVDSLAFGNATDNPSYTFLGTGTAIHNGRIRLKSFTVATLPAGVQGDVAYVTDASAPTYLATVVGGGAVIAPVFYNGTNWVAH